MFIYEAINCLPVMPRERLHERFEVTGEIDCDLGSARIEEVASCGFPAGVVGPCMVAGACAED